LVRHASHDDVDRRLVGRAAGATLGTLGRAQAAQLARFFAKTPPDVVQSSPRERAIQTAQPIAAHVALPCEVAPALDEVDFGAWTGLTFDALAQDSRWSEWNARRASSRAPGGETMAEAQARVLAQIERLRSAGAKRAVLVSHAEPIRALLLHCLGRALDQWSEVDIALASVSTIAVSDGGAQVTAINERIAE
jgi:probable phosphoglycerate mutase